jgi:hypothetical protein
MSYHTFRGLSTAMMQPGAGAGHAGFAAPLPGREIFIPRG